MRGGRGRGKGSCCSRISYNLVTSGEGRRNTSYIRREERGKSVLILWEEEEEDSVAIWGEVCVNPTRGGIHLYHWLWPEKSVLILREEEEEKEEEQSVNSMEGGRGRREGDTDLWKNPSLSLTLSKTKTVAFPKLQAKPFGSGSKQWICGNRRRY